MAVFRNLFKDIDGIFETKFENVTIVEGTDYESGYKRGYEDGERVGREHGYSQGFIDGESEAKSTLTNLSVKENGNYYPNEKSIGFKSVSVSVDTTGAYNDGYKEGKEEGIAEGKAEGESIGYADALAKRTELVITKNGDYTPTGDSTGFKRVSVAVNTQPSQGSYEDGYNDGYQKGLSEGYENGYNEGSSEGYNVGYTNGRSDALAQLKELVVKENGEYLPQDGIGFNKVMVSVEGSGDCDCFTVTLSEDGIIEMHNPPHNYETGYSIYEADEYGNAFDLVSSTSGDSATSWDVSDYMRSGNSYVAIGKIWGQSRTLEYSSKSNIVAVPIKVTLSENGVANIPNVDFDEAYFRLYDAEKDSLIAETGLTRFPIDLSEYMELEKSYYVVLVETMEQSGLEIKSNTIVYSDKTWFLSDITPFYIGYLTIKDNLIVAAGDLWSVFGENGEAVGGIDTDQPFDLSQLDKAKRYSIYNDISGDFAASLQYGTPPERDWLFKDEKLTTEPRTDLPAPVVGTSYTLFVDGAEIVTAICYEIEYFDGLFTEDNEYFVLYIEGEGWQFHPIDSSVTSGTVSIRING